MSVFAVVPVKDLGRAKGRLRPVLEPAARAGLTLYMLRRVLAKLHEAGVERVCVVSPDRVVLRYARRSGAIPLRQESRGLNPALEEGRGFAMEHGASSLLVMPSDLPLIDVRDVRALLELGEDAASVVISPDSARTGTNALLLRPPDALPFVFGADSFEAHLAAARERGAQISVCERPRLAFDLDTGEDLALLERREGANRICGPA